MENPNNKNGHELATEAAQVFTGCSVHETMDGIARLAASTVLGGAQSRAELFERIDQYLNHLPRN